MYLHSLQCTNNVHSALLDIQHICARTHGISSALSMLPAWYFLYTNHDDSAHICRIIDSTQRQSICFAGYCWHDDCLLLAVEPHPLLAVLCAETADLYGAAGRDAVGMRRGTNDEQRGVSGEQHEGAVATCRRGLGMLLCSAPALTFVERRRLVSALPPFAALRGTVLQYVLSEWHSVSTSRRHETTQRIVKRKWIKLTAPSARTGRNGPG